MTKIVTVQRPEFEQQVFQALQFFGVMDEKELKDKLYLRGYIISTTLLHDICYQMTLDKKIKRCDGLTNYYKI